jgi:hypothetical protein
MSGLKILYNLILKDTVKGSGSASGILSIGKDVRKLADKKFQRYITTAKNQNVDLDKLSEQEIKYMLQLNKPKEPQVLSNEEAYEFLNQFLNQGKKGEVIRGKFKPLVTVDSVITDIKKLKPMDSMKETNKVLKGEGKYKNLSKADREKIAGDESVTDHIFERNIEPDPEDFAYGGVAGMLGERTGYNEGGSSIDKGKKGDSQVLPFDFDELDHDELMHIIKLLQTGEIPKLADGGVAGLLGERTGYIHGGITHPDGRRGFFTGAQAATRGPAGGQAMSPGTSTTGGTRHGGGGSGGRRTPPPKKKTTTVTTGGASPFPYTKTPKGRKTSGGITGNDKLRKFILNNKFKTALSGLGGLTTGAAYQTLSDINKINQWAKMGYGTGNPVPKNMLKSLTGAYVPNKVFEKLGYGPGSVKGWLTSRVSPTHFGPVEAVIKGVKSAPVKALGSVVSKISTPLMAGDALLQRTSGMMDESNRISNLEGPAQTQAIENYATKMYKPYADGGPARQNFAMGRRAFLKLLGGAAAGIGALKTGILGFGKGASKQVAKDLTQVPIQSAEGMPSWFKPLVNRVIKEGNDITNLPPNKGGALAEREIVHSAKLGEEQGVKVIQNLDDQTIRVEYQSADNMGGFDDAVYLEYKAPQVIEPPIIQGGKLSGYGKGVKSKAEFSAEEAFPHGTTGDYKDITMEGSNVVTKVDDLYSDTSALKQFGTNKTLSKKELEIAKQKRKRVNEINNDLGEQNQLLPDPPDYDDFASGGLARMLGE